MPNDPHKKGKSYRDNDKDSKRHRMSTKILNVYEEKRMTIETQSNCCTVSNTITKTCNKFFTLFESRVVGEVDI